MQELLRHSTIRVTLDTSLRRLRLRNGMRKMRWVGATMLAGDQTAHPFLWDGKRLIDMGTLGGPFGEAAWVNEAGEVVGLAQKSISCPDGNVGDAFLWSKNVLQDLE